MNAQLPIKPTDERLRRIIKLAVMAVGGQGGGVLTGWIETLARAQGYAVQATSVAGVAQRTGSTIYYIEMAPAGDQMPVFSLAPSGGDVDILIAAEMMEAGRAIMRGFVTPDRTTLIASTHRALAVSEKTVPGDGIAASDEVRAAAEIAADRLILFDMERVALENGSVISASLFGALAGSRALPFELTAFEDAIRASGKGVEPSLRAFNAAVTRAQQPDAAPEATAAAPTPQLQGPVTALQELATLEQSTGHDMMRRGLYKVVDFQDIDYGREYLDRVKPFADQDRDGGALTEAAAKHIANAMCYDDIIRVADRKTRRPRFERIQVEMQADENPVHLTEFFHPRGPEIISLLPARLGTWIEARPCLAAWIDRRVNRSRRVRSHRLSGFLVLYLLAGLKPRRRKTLRHRMEQAHLDNWLATCHAALDHDRDLSIELLRCRRLVKGYSDTHARGLSKFDKVMGALALLKDREDAADWIARLREAALQDEDGTALDGAIETIKSFTP